MPEGNAGNMTEAEVNPGSSSQPGSSKLPLAVGGLVFVAFVVIFSLMFGVFSSSNVAQQPVVAGDRVAHHTEGRSESGYDTEDEYTSMFGDFEDDYYPDSGQLSPADSAEQLAWYEAQKQEIRQERLELEKERTKLRQLHDEVSSLLERRAAIEDANITAMAKLYENMNADEVVPILSNLGDAQVSLIISKMKKRSASEVMGKLAPERAAKITQWLISLESN
jgi:hypothetical protein